MLELKNITKIYNPGTVTEMCLFENFNLTVNSGEFLSIVGSNGSGKTSLLNIICGSIPIENGEVLVSGENIARKKDFSRYQKIGRVYQNPALGTCPNLTMLENMSLADNKGRLFGLGKAVNKSRVDFYREQLAILELGLENKMDIKLGSLSGGQRQAAALIMSTLAPIDFLILDEHTAALDPKTADTIMKLTDRIIREKNLTAMMVTHNLRYAAEYGTRLIMMDNGQIVYEKSGSEKDSVTIDELLKLFNSISIECGN
jgi:putative ABC transport system ATP-binding protein